MCRRTDKRESGALPGRPSRNQKASIKRASHGFRPGGPGLLVDIPRIAQPFISLITSISPKPKQVPRLLPWQVSRAWAIHSYKSSPGYSIQLLHSEVRRSRLLFSSLRAQQYSDPLISSDLVKQATLALIAVSSLHSSLSLFSRLLSRPLH